MELGEHLKYYRKQNQLSQQDLADKLKVSRQSISRWEQNKSYPDLDNLVLLAKIYQISVEELVTGEVYRVNGENNKEESTEEREEIGGIDWIRQGKVLVILILACLIPPVGVLVPSALLLKERKQLHIILKVLCIICIVWSLYNCWILLNERFFAEYDIEIEVSN